MSRTGLNITVTRRPNVRTSNGWVLQSLDAYLDFLERDQHLQNISSVILEKYFPNLAILSETGEAISDYDVVPQLATSDDTEGYKALKEGLPIVNYFGHFLPPSSQMELKGEGNGLVVLDIDLKKLSPTLNEGFLDYVEKEIFDHFKIHPSSVFLYKSISNVGYHLGFLTDAKTKEDYKIVFTQLVDDFKIACHSAKKGVDLSASNFDRGFFAAHNHTVYRQRPSEVYKTDRVRAEAIKANDAKVTTKKREEDGAYDEFPYEADIRLFFAFNRRGNGTFFDSRISWIKMLYTLKHLYPSCYSKRRQFWFEKLSALSPQFRPRDDWETFSNILEKETTSKTGVNFIINHLNGGIRVTEYPTYTWEEVKKYSEEVFGNYDEADAEDTNVFQIDQYIEELAEDIEEYNHVIVDAPPNSGKTTWVLQGLEGKKIILLPTTAILDDIEKKVPQDQTKMIVKGSVTPEEIFAADVILSTYNGITKIMESGITLNEYRLVMDEAHNLFISAAPTFRFDVVDNVVASFHHFEKVILLSGSWIPYPFSSLEFTHLKIRKKKAENPKLVLVRTPNPLNSLVDEMLLEKGKQLALINDKELNESIERLVKKNREKAILTIMNSETKDLEAVKERLQTNQLRPGEILIGTSVILEGISFIDNDIKSLRFYQKLLPEHIAQLSFRPRSPLAEPKIKYYLKRGVFKLSAYSNYQYAYAQTKKNCTEVDTDRMSREQVKDKSKYLIYFEKSRNIKSKNYTPYVHDTGTRTTVLNRLLLGYYSLEMVGESLNTDLLTMLTCLRKWNFSFCFEEMGVSMTRETFKKVEEEEQKEMLRDCFTEICSIPEELLQGEEKDFIYRAWSILKCIQTEYFIMMSAEDRVALFSIKKRFQKLVEEVQSRALYENKTFQVLEKFQSNGFKEKYINILLNLKQLQEADGRIYHDNYDMTIHRLKLRTTDVNDVLKKYFNKQSSESTTRNGRRVRYFKIAPKEFPFNNYLNIDESKDYYQDRMFLG